MYYIGLLKVTEVLHDSIAEFYRDILEKPAK